MNSQMETKMTLDQLIAMFPKTQLRAHYSYCPTGYIPVAFYNAHMSEFRAIKKAHKLRVYFRGPRTGGYGSCTLKAYATHVVLYPK